MITSKQPFVIWWGVSGGPRPGVYQGWKECSSAVDFKGARCHRFTTREAAQRFAFGSQTPLPSTVSDDTSTNNNKRPAPPNEVDPYAEIIVKRSRHYDGKNLPNALTNGPDGMHVGRTVIYTDGACSGNGKAHAKGGMGVYWGKGDPRNFSGPLKDGVVPTNNRAELTACIIALSHPDVARHPVEIKTDSKYIVEAVTGWLRSCKARGWKKVNGQPLLNQDLFSKLWDLVERRSDVYWTWVEGHSKIPGPDKEGNDAADKLATDGVGMD